MFNFSVKPTLKEIVQANAVQAVEHAKNMNIDLDYTNESIDKVQMILNTMYESAQVEPPSEEGYAFIANAYGSYVGETLIKNIGIGEWVMPSEGEFAGALYININGFFVFLPAKVYRRLKNGPEDNVKYMYIDCLNKYKPGTPYGSTSVWI